MRLKLLDLRPYFASLPDPHRETRNKLHNWCRVYPRAEGESSNTLYKTPLLIMEVERHALHRHSHEYENLAFEISMLLRQG